MQIIVRLGGDEFVLLLPGSSAEHAVDVTERVRDAMALHQVVSEEAVFQITISAGVSCISSDEDKLDMLLACADQALYESKERGRNRVSMA